MENCISLSSFKDNVNNHEKDNLLNFKLPLTKTGLVQEEDKVELKKELDQAVKQNGLIEKLSDKIKKHTKKVISADKIEKKIEEGKSAEEIRADIKKYRNSQENIAQTAGDIISILGVTALFFLGKTQLSKLQSVGKINSEEIIGSIKQFAQGAAKREGIPVAGGITKKIGQFLQKGDNVNKTFNVITSNHFANALLALPAAIVSGLFKNVLLKADRIGTKQYKLDVDKQELDEEEYRQLKRSNKKERKSANRRNFFSGSINGLMLPIVSALGVVGVPIYVIGNALNRFFVGKKENKGERNLKGFVNDIKSSPITYTAGALAIAAPLIVSGRSNKILEKNLKAVVENLKKADLKEANFGKTSYQELEDILFGNDAIKSILDNRGLTVEEKIKMLGDENIFALKFKQIQGDYDELAQALKEKCPETWTLQEAQEQIEKSFQKRYQLKRCVGTGTVAQTFLAQDSETGKDVCIKLIHKGMNAERIAKDEEAFVKMIEASSKTPEEKKFLIDNLKNLAQGVKQEVDLTNEMEAAKKLAEVTKKANVVKPICVKDGIYVMEKANGISLSSLTKFMERGITQGENGKFLIKKWDSKIGYQQISLDEHIKNLRAELEQSYYKSPYSIREINELEELQELLKNNPELLKLNKKEIKKMLEQYQDILIEQFSMVDKNGKVIHGDIHPGNIFIDLEKLQSGKHDFFTLIDTGNTIQQNRDMALRFMHLTKYVKNADYENIARFVLDGATLPEGMSQEKAYELVSSALKDNFFDTKTALKLLNNDEILAMTDGIMQKNGIIPASTQGNLMKAKQSASNSLYNLQDNWFDKIGQEIEEKMKDVDQKSAQGIATMVTTGASAAKDGAKIKAKNDIKRIMQERLNLRQLTPQERMKLKNASGIKKNSKEYLTYFLKQHKNR